MEEEEEDVGRQREREKGRRIRGEVHNTTKRGGGATAAEKRGVGTKFATLYLPRDLRDSRPQRNIAIATVQNVHDR